MLTTDVIKGSAAFVYEISEAKKPFALELKMDKGLIAQGKDLSSAIFVRELQKKHNLKSFSLLGDDCFGFDRALKKIEETEKTISYLLEIPTLVKESSQPCIHCLGTGWDKSYDQECLWCHGRKKHVEYDWKPFFAISASLQIFCFLAETSDRIKISDKRQLLAFQNFCGDSINGFPLFGAYGYDFCKWLTSFPDHYCFEIAREKMAKTYEHIFKQKKDWWHFNTYVKENAWLIINCPGDASNLHPVGCGWNQNEHRGQQFSCHNLDCSTQQLMLLTALAVLSDLARKSINKK